MGLSQQGTRHGRRLTRRAGPAVRSWPVTAPLTSFLRGAPPRPNPAHPARAGALCDLAARAEAAWMRPRRERLAEARGAAAGDPPGPDAAWERMAARGLVPPDWVDGSAERGFVSVVEGAHGRREVRELSRPADEGAAVAIAADVPGVLAVESLAGSINETGRRWTATDPGAEVPPPARVLWSAVPRAPGFERVEDGRWQYPLRDELSRRWRREGASVDSLLPPDVRARLEAEARGPDRRARHAFLRLAIDALLFERYAADPPRGDPFRALRGAPNPLEQVLEIAALGYCPIGPIFDARDFGILFLPDRGPASAP